ncbi:hypothetical protein HKW97_23390 (plasmid) [Pseudomonas luteola]|uniref:hypothetical protein n=1 Tax=Pseudomonas luteola TaxID=47886 RepID=UPI003891017C
MRSQTITFEITSEGLLKKNGRNEVVFQQAREFNPHAGKLEGGIHISKHSLSEREIKRFVDRILAFAEHDLVELGANGRPNVTSERLYVAGWFQEFTSHGVVPEQARPVRLPVQDEHEEAIREEPTPLVDLEKTRVPAPGRVIEALAGSPLKLRRMSLVDGKQRIAVLCDGRPFIICGQPESRMASGLAHSLASALWLPLLARYLGIEADEIAVGTISEGQYKTDHYHALCLDSRPLCLFDLPEETHARAGVLCLDDDLGSLLLKQWNATGIRVKDMARIDALCRAAPALVNSLDRLERAVSAISLSPLITEMVDRPVQVARQALAQALGHS